MILLLVCFMFRCSIADVDVGVSVGVSSLFNSYKALVLEDDDACLKLLKKCKRILTKNTVDATI